MRSILFFLLFIPVVIVGQNIEKISLRINYNYLIQVENFEKMSTNEFDVHYPFQKPTFLGNYKSFDIDLALKIKPKQLPLAIEFIFRQTEMKFTGGDYYNNLKCNLLSPGIGILYKFPFSNNISGTGYVNFLLSKATITRDYNEKHIYFNEFVYLIRHDPMKEVFIVPVIEPGLEIEYRITSMLGFQTRIGMALSSFPDFDTESPLFYKTLILSAGFRYIISRNKSLIY